MFKIIQMSKIIVIGNQKGGVGKSQVSLMLATALSQEPFKLKVCVIDLDNQKSILRTRNFDVQAYEVDSVPFDIKDYEIQDLQINISTLDKTFDLIFIDTAGKLDNKQPLESQEVTKALMYADIVFMPFVAGNHNLESTLDYFRFIKTVQNIRSLQSRNLSVYGFVNMYRARSRANAFLISDIENLKAAESLKMMQTALNDYSIFKDADTITSIYDAQSGDPAKANFAAFLNEFVTILKN